MGSVASSHSISAPADSARFRVAAVQMNSGGSIEENLARIQSAIQKARRRRADAVLFPECATTGYTYNFKGLKPAEIAGALRQLGDWASRYTVNLLVGSPVFRGRRLYNCLVAFDRTGRVVHCYAKCQLTPWDRTWFTPGNRLALFELDRIPCTAIVCHERRYPELVRLPVMAGARVVFHPNAGLDPLKVSRQKRGGKDGIGVRAFENAVYYVFANSVGPQGGGKWSAGDSKIVDPGGKIVRLADNRSEQVIVAELDLTRATGKYARDSLEHPKFLAGYWRRMLRDLKERARCNELRYR